MLPLEHIGSTSVPGLTAKPIIQILLAVADSADEQAYLPAMEAAGYVLHICEPEWHEHRLFKGPESASIFTSSRSRATKFAGCSRFATGCGATALIASYKSAPSVNLPSGAGSTRRTTRTPRRTWPSKSSRAHLRKGRCAESAICRERRNRPVYLHALSRGLIARHFAIQAQREPALLPGMRTLSTDHGTPAPFLICSLLCVVAQMWGLAELPAVDLRKLPP
jgi:GrpB protein